jgi:DNA mismatch endonuclease (patch repair protein)
MDVVSPAKRSAMMSNIRSEDTKPELTVRRLLHKLGFRFRLHRKDLPGRPDIVLPKHRAIILIHGCFWHGHECKIASRPKSNTGYWLPKIETNRLRDERNIAALEALGWKVLILWECEIRNKVGLSGRLEDFLGRNNTTAI